MINDSVDALLFTLEQRKDMFIPVAKHSAAISRLAWRLKLQSCATCVHSLVCDSASSSGVGMAHAGLGIFPLCPGTWSKHSLRKQGYQLGLIVNAVFTYMDNVHI